MSNEIGDRLKKARIAKGYSQYQLADIIEMDQSLISKWESGTKKPNENVIKVLEDRLGADLHSFYKGEPERKPFAERMKEQRGDPSEKAKIQVYEGAVDTIEKLRKEKEAQERLIEAMEAKNKEMLKTITELKASGLREEIDRLKGENERLKSAIVKMMLKQIEEDK